MSSWVNEPWSYNNIRKASKWVADYLQPEIDRLASHLNRMTAEQWTILKMTNTAHPDIKLLYQYQREVKDMWFKRPRFPEDKGRMQEEGF